MNAALAAGDVGIPANVDRLRQVTSYRRTCEPACFVSMASSEPGAAHSYRISHLYGIWCENGSILIISPGSWTSVAQFASIATLVPMHFHPLVIPGGILTRT